VQRDPRVARQPGLDLGVFVGAIVVADHVQLGARVGAGDLFEEVEEFAVAVAGVARVGDLARGDLQRSEQRAGAVADVVVGAPGGQPGAARGPVPSPLAERHSRVSGGAIATPSPDPHTHGK
jgi:hypothetical protein